MKNEHYGDALHTKDLTLVDDAYRVDMLQVGDKCRWYPILAERICLHFLHENLTGSLYVSLDSGARNGVLCDFMDRCFAHSFL